MCHFEVRSDHIDHAGNPVIIVPDGYFGQMGSIHILAMQTIELVYM